MKKVIRITEEDLRKIISRIVENSAGLDVAAKTVLKGVFGPTSSSTPTSGGTENNQVSTDADVIKKANELKITNGEWSRLQSTSPTIQLSYKKSPNDKQWTPLVTINTPKHIKRTNGKWSISNNKLNITD